MSAATKLRPLRKAVLLVPSSGIALGQLHARPLLLSVAVPWQLLPLLGFPCHVHGVRNATLSDQKPAGRLRRPRAALLYRTGTACACIHVAVSDMAPVSTREYALCDAEEACAPVRVCLTGTGVRTVIGGLCSSRRVPVGITIRVHRRGHRERTVTLSVLDSGVVRTSKLGVRTYSNE